ncbi:MAG: c-type cytochrome [Spirochaetales bacterium]|nr:c-type cytochrome [Spirochaetales bacterium]
MQIPKRCILISGIVAAVLACGPDAETKKLMEQARSVFGTLPDRMPGSENDTKDRIKLGEMLYEDKRLSINDQQSCSSCHILKDGKAGVDNLRVSKGALPGTEGNRNSPTVLNAGFHLAQFWDGRAADLVEQAKGPILNPVEMGMPDEKTVVEKLKKIPEYVDLFARAFPAEKEALTYQNIAEAIASFERTLRTSDRFDAFQNGKASALGQEEKAGLKAFMEAGCTTCHNGNLLGGRMYQKMGLINPYGSTDKGRFDVTKKETDLHVFKVPSLRNVALTAPYFHDGKAATLEDAVRQMAHLQLGKELTEEQTKTIVAFLGSLSDTKLTR